MKMANENSLQPFDDLLSARQAWKDALMPARKISDEFNALRGMREAFIGSTAIQDLARSAVAATSEIGSMREIVRFGIQHDFRKMKGDLASQISLGASLAKVHLGSTLAEIAQRSSFASDIAAHARQFDGLKRQWMMPSALEETLKALRSPAGFAEIKLPVIDFASIAAINAAWDAGETAEQIRALLDGFDDPFVDRALVPACSPRTGITLPDFWTTIGILIALITVLYQHIDSAQAEARLNSRLDGLSEAHDIEVAQLKRMEQLLGELLATRPEAGRSACFVTKRRAALVRTSNEPGSAILASIFPNQLVTLHGARGKWIYVEYYDWLKQQKRFGWTLKKYFQRVPQCRPLTDEE